MTELPKPFYKDDRCTIYHGDCREILPLLPKFDLLLTDPPYGLGYRLTGGKGEWGRHFEKSPDWDQVLSPEWVIKRCVEISNLAIVWGGNYYSLPPTRCWIAWDKIQNHTSGHFEMAWTTFDKPTRMFRLSRVEAYSSGKAHPTQKPLPLMQWCLSFAPDAQTVLDPFMGSGTTLVAAKLEGRQAVGIEINERYCEIAAERLRQGVLF